MHARAMRDPTKLKSNKRCEIETIYIYMLSEQINQCNMHRKSTQRIQIKQSMHSIDPYYLFKAMFIITLQTRIRYT
jgi:hypothetical protein